MRVPLVAVVSMLAAAGMVYLWAAPRGKTMMDPTAASQGSGSYAAGLGRTPVVVELFTSEGC